MDTDTPPSPDKGSSAGKPEASGLGKFWQELKRSDVVRTAVVYLVVGWLMVCLPHAEITAKTIVLPRFSSGSVAKRPNDDTFYQSAGFTSGSVFEQHELRAWAVYDLREIEPIDIQSALITISVGHFQFEFGQVDIYTIENDSINVDSIRFNYDDLRRLIFEDLGDGELLCSTTILQENTCQNVASYPFSAFSTYVASKFGDYMIIGIRNQREADGTMQSYLRTHDIQLEISDEQTVQINEPIRISKVGIFDDGLIYGPEDDRLFFTVENKKVGILYHVQISNELMVWESIGHLPGNVGSKCLWTRLLTGKNTFFRIIDTN